MNRKIFLIFLSFSVFFISQVFCMQSASLADRASDLTSRLKEGASSAVVLPDIERLVNDALKLKRNKQLSVEAEDALAKLLLRLAKEPAQRSKALEFMQNFEALEKKAAVSGKAAYPDPELRAKGLELYKLIAEFYANDKKLDEREIAQLLERLEYLEKNELTQNRRASFASIAALIAKAPPVKDVGIEVTGPQRDKLNNLVNRLRAPVGFPKRIDFLYSKIDAVREMDEASIDVFFSHLFMLCEEFAQAKATGKKPEGERRLLDLLNYAALIPKFQPQSGRIKYLQRRITGLQAAPSELEKKKMAEEEKKKKEAEELKKKEEEEKKKAEVKPAPPTPAPVSVVSPAARGRGPAAAPVGRGAPAGRGVPAAGRGAVTRRVPVR